MKLSTHEVQYFHTSLSSTTSNSRSHMTIKAIRGARGCISLLLSRLSKLPGRFEYHKLGNLAANKEMQPHTQQESSIMDPYVSVVQSL